MNPREGTWRCLGCGSTLNTALDRPGTWTSTWVWSGPKGAWLHFCGGGCSPAERADDAANGEPGIVVRDPQRLLGPNKEPVYLQGLEHIVCDPFTATGPVAPAVEIGRHGDDGVFRFKVGDAYLTREELSSLRAQLETVTRERDEARAVLSGDGMIAVSEAVLDRWAKERARLREEVAALRSQDRRAVVRVDNGWDD